MKLSSDILYHDLSEWVRVERSGIEIDTLSLEPPIFYREGMSYEAGKVYIGRAGEFPEPGTAHGSLIICIGGRMPLHWAPRGCCLFTIPEETNLPQLFNWPQAIYVKYEEWIRTLREIVNTTEDIGALVAVTAPVLGGAIGCGDKELRIIAQANSDGTSSLQAGHIQTKEKAMSFSDSHPRNSAMQEPFIYKERDGSISYCINIFLQDRYEGVITITNGSGHPRPGQKLLFQEFSLYIAHAMRSHSERGTGDATTLKAVFRELLDCMDVSEKQMRRALSSVDFGKDGWLVMVGRPKDSAHNLPMAYLCANVESSIQGAAAVAMEERIAILIPLAERSDEKRCQLEELVHSFFGFAGMSNIFHDLWHTRFYYNQAVAAVTIAMELESQDILCRFQDYALAYALSNSTGKLPVRYMLPEGLLQLWEGCGGQEYDAWNTLKTYLDNEMSGTRTAQDLYIHRTTLQNRLRRIEQLVDLSTAQSRMYIRYCIHLCELQVRLKR